MKSSGHAGGLLQRELPKPSKELAGVRSNDGLQALLLVSNSIGGQVFRVHFGFDLSFED